MPSALTRITCDNHVLVMICINCLEQAADADTAAAARIEQLEAEVQKLLQELEACNDLLEQEWSKTAEQAEIMASLAADVTRWQVCALSRVYDEVSCKR